MSEKSIFEKKNKIKKNIFVKSVFFGKNIYIKKEKEFIKIKGPLGEVDKIFISKEINLFFKERSIEIKSENKAMCGTYKSLIENYIFGVEKGYKKILKVEGIGYKVIKKEKNMEFSLGKSHLDYVSIPSNLNVNVENNIITIIGIDKQIVGHFAANKIRNLKIPSVYKKSKGIYYLGEQEKIKLKPGKSLNK